MKKDTSNKKNKTNIIIVAALAVLVVGVMIFVIAKVTGDGGSDGDIKTTKVNGVDNPYGVEPSTNIDGTPVEIQPYTMESGTPYVNDEGNPVYYIIGTENNEDGPVLVTRGGVDTDKLQTFVIQKTEKDENGELIISPATKDDSEEAPTTKFIPTTSADKDKDSKDTTAGEKDSLSTTAKGDDKQTETTKKGSEASTTKKNDSNSSQSTTEKVNNEPLPDKINLGGPWGTVTKDTNRGENVYKGRIVESELEALKTPVTYSKVGATFTRGIYIPEKIGEYKVVQVAYTRFYEFKDPFEGSYDWYTQISIFKPGMPNDPLVYIEKNDTFNVEAQYAEPMKIFLIELSR